MVKYEDWRLTEEKIHLYELYILGPGINPVAEKAEKALRGVVPNPKSFLVAKFRGTKKDVDKAEKALASVGFRVVDSEIENH